MPDPPTRIAKVCDPDANVIGYVCTPIHTRRWQGLAAWIVLFTLLVFLALVSARSASDKTNRLIRDNQAAIASLNATKVDIVSLKKTNCGLRRFLVSAATARRATARSETGRRRASDLRAARGYEAIAGNYPSAGCDKTLREPHP